MVRKVLAGNLFRVACVTALLGLLPRPAPAQAAPEHKNAAPALAQRGVFLVFPFEFTGAEPRLDWLGAGLEELTIQRLSAAGQQVFTHEGRSAELDRYGLPPSAKFSRASMLRIAEDLDADYVLFGSFSSDGKGLTIEARLLRVTPAALLPPVRETGPLDSLMDLHTRVLWRLLSSNDPTFPLNLGEFTRVQRPLRLDAFEHYVRGRLAIDDEPRLRELREAVRLEPDWPEPAFALGQALFTRRDCSTAITWFGRVPKSHDRYIEAVFSTGVCRLWLNQPDRAEEIFAALQETLKNSSAGAGDLPEVLNNLAIARERNGKTAAAQADLRHALELDPDENDYPFNLGLLSLRANDAAGATAHAREAVQRQPDDPEARALLILALERSALKSEADAERAAAAESFGGTSLPVLRAENLPRLDRVKTELDVTSLRQEIETADVTAPASSASAPANGLAAHLKAGRQQLSAGHLPEAEREFRAVLAADAHDPAAHRGLGEVYRRQNRLDDAAAELRASLEARDSAVARTALARVYLDQKKQELARHELERALQLAPNYTEAKQLLQRLETEKPGASQ